jgi:hypothetical protein
MKRLSLLNKVSNILTDFGGLKVKAFLFFKKDGKRVRYDVWSGGFSPTSDILVSEMFPEDEYVEENCKKFLELLNNMLEGYVPETWEYDTVDAVKSYLESVKNTSPSP